MISRPLVPANDAAIERIANGIANHTLPKLEWTHSAHFAAALVLLRRDGLAATRTTMPGIIRAYNVATGVANTDTGGYHETITQASLGGAAAVLAALPQASLPVVLARLLAGPLGNRDWMLAHWSSARLMSVEARRLWLAPDLAPLPFPAPEA
jgi:hypothetical protein